MSAIFISHSSADNAEAVEMKAWLEAQGHTSLFLDFDPEAGIKGGTSWERTLYRQLRQCQAVIALLSPEWLASKWCFAELVQARERDKAIFPVKVRPCEARKVFSDIQAIDLTVDPEEGYRRLRLGLLERGLDPLDVFDWDPKRPPYPGLLAFQEQDAAIFFGRGEDILKTLKTLDTLRRSTENETARFALLLGTSGSGKSSLARAGIIPRLKKKPAEWLPLPPFRPQVEPLDELALALASAFEAHGRPGDWEAIRTQLHTAAQSPADTQIFTRLLRDLAVAARQTEATVLLTIDQAEELFGYRPPEAATRFLRLLRAALETGDRRLIAVATLRSDFLGEFQSHPVLQDSQYPHHFRYCAITVDPMPLRNFPAIIRGPARLAGLELDDGLVEAMANDTATRDALPLLAFALRRLYDRFGEDGRLRLDEYESLGRLEGAIREEAERVVAEAKPDQEELDALHAAFVPAMVRINAEGGYARRRALVDELPRRALALLRRFVDARLLVAGRDPQNRETNEVAHEALLRTWPQLANWLVEDRDKLRLLESLQRAVEEWNQGGRGDESLTHRNSRLRDAEGLLANPRFAVLEGSNERAYLDACRAAQDAHEATEKEERERRLRDAERIAEEQTKVAEAQKNIAQRTKIALVIVMLVAGLAVWQYIKAEKATKIATSDQLAAQARVGLDLRAPYNLLLALESIEITRQVGTFSLTTSRQLLNDVLNETGGIPLQHAAPVVAATFSPDDRWLASASANTVQLWDVQSPDAAPIILQGYGNAVSALAFSPDGQTLATVGSEAGVRLWDVTAAGRSNSRFLAGHSAQLVDVGFSRNGRWLASASKDGPVQLWDLTAVDPAKSSSILPHEQGVNTLAFSPDNHWLATGSVDKKVRLWDLGAPKIPAEPMLFPVPGNVLEVRKVAFSPDSQWLAAGADENYQVLLWRLSAPDKSFSLPIEQWGTLAFSPDGRWLATPSLYDAKLWDLNKPDPSIEAIVLPGHKNYIADLAFSPDGQWFATGSGDFTAQLWNMADRRTPIVLRGHEQPISRIAFSHDSRHLATASEDHTVRLWSTSSPAAEPLALRTPDRSTKLHLWDMRAKDLPTLPQVLGEELKDKAGTFFSPDGRWLAALSANPVDSVDLWDLSTPSPTHYVVRHEGDIWASPVFSPDGRWLATGGVGDPTVRLWDLKAPDPTSNPQMLRGHSAAIRSLAFSANGHSLVTGANDGLALVWDLTSADPSTNLTKLAGGGSTSIVSTVTISRDGRYVVTGSWEPDYAARIWDLSSPFSSANPIKLTFENRLDEVAISPDGRWVAAGSWDKTTQLLDMKKSGGKPFVLRRHTARTLAVGFSPDSQWLATGNEDRTARLW
ncbi:MAG: TIR domain-containing protein, partial [Methylococcales bacterium]